MDSKGETDKHQKSVVCCQLRRVFLSYPSLQETVSELLAKLQAEQETTALLKSQLAELTSVHAKVDEPHRRERVDPPVGTCTVYYVLWARDLL